MQQTKRTEPFSYKRLLNEVFEGEKRRKRIVMMHPEKENTIWYGTRSEDSLTLKPSFEVALVKELPDALIFSFTEHGKIKRYFMLTEDYKIDFYTENFIFRHFISRGAFDTGEEIGLQASNEALNKFHETFKQFLSEIPTIRLRHLLSGRGVL